MINFFRNPKEKIFQLKEMDRDALIYRVFPRLLAELMRKYFRVEVEGIENIPKHGPVVIAPNHSGFTAFDAILLAHILQKDAKRVARVMTHHLWFFSKTIAIPAQKIGFVEATYENGVRYLKKNNLIVLFPEGENGNFKPSSQRYELQEFKRGFVRMALETKSAIVPTLIVGAEEANINLSQLRFTKFLKGMVIPIPLNILPLPVKWKIKFLAPVDLPFSAAAKDDRELVHDLCQEIQERMQKSLIAEVKKRGLNVF